MADVLVTGIKIGDMPLKGTVSGNEKLPTGDVGDLAVTPNQIKNFTIQEGNLVNQEQLDDAIESVEQTASGLAGRVGTLEERTSNINNTADLDKPISSATQAALDAKADKVDVDAKLDLKADKDKVVSSFNGQTGAVTLDQSDLVDVGPSFTATPSFQDVPKLTKPDGSSIPEFDSQIQPLVNSIAVHRQGLTPTFDQAFADVIGGYPLNARLMLDNGDIVKSTTPNNTVNPNVDMVGWDNPQKYLKTQVSFYATPENFGAKGDGVTDDYTALQSAFNSGLKVQLQPNKTYLTSRTLTHSSNFILHGCGSDSSKIVKTSTTTSGLSPIPAPNSAGNVNYDRDAVLIAVPTSGGYVTGCDIQGVSLEKSNDHNFTGYGYFAPYLAQSTFKNFVCRTFEYAIYTVNCWMTEWVRCQGQGKAGWVLGGLGGDLVRGGTSTNLISCWSLSTRSGYYAWNIYNMHSSNFISASSDFVGTETDVADGVWNIVNCENITLLNGGCELVRAKQLFRIRDSQVKVDGWYFEQFFNRYGGATSYLIDIDGASRVNISKCNFICTNNIGQYPDSPRFIKVGTASTLVYDRDNFTYPRITGIDNFSEFSIDVLGSSFADIKTNGYHYIRNKGSNLAIPSVTTKLVDTDMGYRTTGEITSTSATDGVYFGLTSATAGRWNTARFRIGNQHFFYSNAMNALLYKNGAPTNDTDGVPTYLPVGTKVGTTEQRPVAPFLFAGRYYWDTTLKKPIWYNGTNWTDANGTVV